MLNSVNATRGTQIIMWYEVFVLMYCAWFLPSVALCITLLSKSCHLFRCNFAILCKLATLFAAFPRHIFGLFLNQNECKYSLAGIWRKFIMNIFQDKKEPSNSIVMVFKEQMCCRMCCPRERNSLICMASSCTISSGCVIMFAINSECANRVNTVTVQVAT